MKHPLFGLIGVTVILLFAVLISRDRKAIRPRIVLTCFGLQVAVAIFVLYTSAGQGFIGFLAGKVNGFLGYADAGINMIFGGLASENVGFSFFTRVLPIVIFFAAFMEVVYHLKIMQKIVYWGGRGLRAITGTRPVETLNVIANIFIGQTEAPLSLRPYLPHLTQAELFAVMVSGMASVAGTVLAGYAAMGIQTEYLLTACLMSAPGGLLMAKLIMPDDKDEAQVSMDDIITTADEQKHVNVIMAAGAGAQNGVKLAVNIGAMLLAFVSLIAVMNGFLGWGGERVGLDGLTVQKLLGYIFAPIMWLLNVPSDEILLAGGLFGEKIILNEFVAYASMSGLQGDMSPQTVVVLTFALCGFANLSSIGIMLGGLGALIPDRMNDIAKMGLLAVLAASLANLMSAALAGILFGLSSGLA